MIRRTFFQLLTGFWIPQPRWPAEHSKAAAGPVPKRVQFLPLNDVPESEWLKEWLRLPRLPVLSDDLAQIAEPQERDLAALILQRIRSGVPIDFQYFGGLEPGKPRQVLPVLLFTTAPDAMPSGADDPNPIYLLAWCQARNAPRTFRLDRIQLQYPLRPVETGNESYSLTGQPT